MNLITYNSIRNNIQSFGILTQGLGNHADGNMLTYDGATFTWDGENRMKTAIKDGKVTNLSGKEIIQLIGKR